jgi:hypothetical protein
MKNTLTYHVLMYTKSAHDADDRCELKQERREHRNLFQSLLERAINYYDESEHQNPWRHIERHIERQP